jgi:hypothetical protein
LLVRSEPTQVLDGTDLLHHGQTLRKSDRGELLLPQLLNGVLVVAQVQLGADQNDGRLRTVVAHLGKPFGAHILERGGTDDENIKFHGNLEMSIQKY